MTYARAMAEKLTKAVLNAYNRARPTENAMGAAFQVAQAHVMEVITDTRVVIGEAIEHMAEIEIEVATRTERGNIDGKRKPRFIGRAFGRRS